MGLSPGLVEIVHVKYPTEHWHMSLKDDSRRRSVREEGIPIPYLQRGEDASPPEMFSALVSLYSR